MTQVAADVIKKLLTTVVNPIVSLLFAAAAFYFIWGVFKYITTADDPSERAAGARHIAYSILGIFIMASVWGIIALIKNTLHLT